MKAIPYLLLCVLLVVPFNSGAQELDVMPGGVVLPIQIPDCDPGGIESRIQITGCDMVEDVGVSLIIEHGWVGDLVVTLQSPSGTEVTLVDRPGFDGSGYGCGFAGMTVVLDDDALSPVESQCEDDNGGTVPAITGTFRPNQPLQVFHGELGSGTWTLRVSDWAAANSGRLAEWQLDTGCRSLDVDLQPQFAADRESARPGDTVILTMRLANIGSEQATGVEAVYRLPAGLRCLWAEPGALAENGLIAQRHGSMLPGESVSASMAVQVTAGQWGWQSIGVSTTSEQTDSKPGDNKASARFYVGPGAKTK